MTAATVLALRESQLVPVVTITALDEVDAIADGLVAGGVGCVEITLRTPHGVEAIRRMAARGDLVVGAGTVLDEESLHAAAEAGAAFLVSPGLDERLVRSAGERGLLPLPGVATATEVQHARRIGLRHVKLFPISTLGGASLVEALHPPFPEMSFMPSGGVTSESAPRYLAHPAVFAVGASWLVRTSSGEGLAERVSGLSRDSVRSLARAADDG